MTERDIFLAVLDLPDLAARVAYLDTVCAGDAALRSQVEALIRSHAAADSFLAEPAVAPPQPNHAVTDAFSVNSNADDIRTTGGTDGPDDEALDFLSPPGRPDSLGRIGHYEVLEVLGRGGFGIVFRAFDEVLQRVVAVKVLAPQMAATSPARKRFLREARSSAQVRHENVVQVYAVEEQPLPYLVMEFIPGETLQQRLDRTGPLDLPEVLRIGRQVAEGLAAAHAQGLIHRDVKPANVLIEGGPTQRVKLTDFGLARAADDASISQSGVVAGTPMYMAPEQAKGETLDLRADLFSFGSVLYVMCAGRPPFRASGMLAVLKRVCEEDPRPIREVIPEVPAWLCRVIAKLHAKDPADRFQTAREAADVLADAETQVKTFGVVKDYSRIPGGSAPRKRRPRVAAMIGVLALPLLLCAAVWFGPYALRYVGNTGEIVVLPESGFTDVIVWRDGNAVTDWFAAKNRPTIKLPPGAYELKPGFAPGRAVERWEVTTQGLFGNRTAWQGTRDFEVDVARGERVTVRAVMRDDPSTALAAAQRPTAATSEGAQAKRRFASDEWIDVISLIDPRLDKRDIRYTGRNEWRIDNGELFVGYADAKGNKLLFPLDGDWTAYECEMEFTRFAGRRGITLDIPAANAVCSLDFDAVGDGKLDLGKAPMTLTEKVRIETGMRTSIRLVVRKQNGTDHLSVWFNGEPVGEWTGDRADIARSAQEGYRHDRRLSLWIQAGGNQYVFHRIRVRTLDGGTAETLRPVLIATRPATPPPAVAPFDAKQARAHQETWAKHLGVKVETTNSIFAKMVLIPPGEFLMGSTDEQVEAAVKMATETKADDLNKYRILNTERPRHRVVITRPFLIGATVVTVGQFKAFAAATAYQTKAEIAAKADPQVRTYQNPGFDVSDDFPASNITWNDATAFYKWLSEKEKVVYRLPTEAEWEYVCRAGTTTQFSFGDDRRQLGQYAWYDENSDSKPHAVGAKLPNPFGLFDMHGDVYEWCQDFWTEGSYEKSSADDPSGPVFGVHRVIRGGCWDRPATSCRSAFRGGDISSRSTGSYGFRVIRVLDAPVTAVAPKAGS